MYINFYLVQKNLSVVVKYFEDTKKIEICIF